MTAEVKRCEGRKKQSREKANSGGEMSIRTKIEYEAIRVVEG